MSYSRNLRPQVKLSYFCLVSCWLSHHLCLIIGLSDVSRKSKRILYFSGQTEKKKKKKALLYKHRSIDLIKELLKNIPGKSEINIVKDDR